MINDKMTEGIIQFIITVLFYVEALIHYNIGKHGTFKFSLPKFKKIYLYF